MDLKVEDIFAEYIWHCTLAYINHHLLHDINNRLTGNLALSELYSINSLTSIEEAINIFSNMRSNCYKERDALLQFDALNSLISEQSVSVHLKSFLEKLIPLLKYILPQKAHFQFDAEMITFKYIQGNTAFLYRIFIQCFINIKEATQNISQPEIYFKSRLDKDCIVCIIEDNGQALLAPEQAAAQQSLTITDCQNSAFKISTSIRFIQFFLSKMKGKFQIEKKRKQGNKQSIFFQVYE